MKGQRALNSVCGQSDKMHKAQKIFGFRYTIKGRNG